MTALRTILATLAAFLAASPAMGGAAAGAPHATAHVGGYVVRWPDVRGLTEGMRFTLVVAPSGRAPRDAATVTLARVARSGRVLGPVKRRRVRHARVRLQVPPLHPGRYRLSVAAGGRAVTRTFIARPQSPVVGSPPVIGTPTTPEPCAPARRVEASLAVTPATAHAGDTLTLSLKNTGASCFWTGLGVSWEQQRNGDWVDVPLDRPVPAIALSVEPGQTHTESFLVPSDATPGHYRAVKQISGDNTSVRVTAEVTIL